MKKNLIKADLLKTSSTSLFKRTIEPEGVQPAPYNNEQLAEIYSYNGYHSKCINLKSMLTSGLGYEVFSVINHIDEINKLNKFINEHYSNTGLSLVELLYRFQTDYEIFGNAYLEVVRNSVGEVSALFHLPAKDMRIAVKNNKQYAVQIINGSEICFSEFGKREGGMNEFISIKNYNPLSRFYGQPEYMGALSSIVLDRYSVEFNINKFNNNAVPESIIFIKGGILGKDAKMKIKDFFTNNFKGLENRGRSLILETEDEKSTIEVKAVSQPVNEASYNVLRENCRDEIIAAHGIPRRMLGMSDGGSLGGYNETRNQLKIFQECVITPRQKKLEYILNDLIIKKGLDLHSVEIKLNQLYVENPEADAKFYEIMIKAGILTTDEARKELGYSV
ncbi:MAG TPA: phage portal protein [Ignavibacteriaceae bacterium]|nr:phage portal protein [Ignavibacteriaceae bacterium]